MTIKTRVMKGTKQTYAHMFERMVQRQVEDLTGMTVYASGVAYNEECDMWFFKCEALCGTEFHSFEGYVGCLGKLVITKMDGEKKEVA